MKPSTIRYFIREGLSGLKMNMLMTMASIVAVAACISILSFSYCVGSNLRYILGAGTGESNLFFNVMLHVGTLVAVVAFYHKLVWDLIKEFFLMLKDIFTGKFKWSKMNYNRNLVVMLIIGLIPLFLLFLPIPGTDMKLKDLADRLSASPVLIVTACSLILTSVLFLHRAAGRW